MLTSTIFGGLLPFAIIVMALIGLFVSAIGFKKYVYFISIGYGYSIAAMAIVALVFAGPAATAISWAQCALLIAYGMRLGTYLVIRETKPAYQATQKTDGDRPEKVGLGLKILIWVTVAVLYAVMFMPALARVSAESRGMADPLWGLSAAGIAVMALGLLIEAVADAQKSAAKKKAPHRFCDAGLYRFTRCPNYFGEMLVWTGNLVAGAALLGNWLAWLLAALGYVSIILVMIGSGRRLEMKQEARYGNDPEFKAYTAKTPVIIPFLPIYSLKNAKLYLG